MLFMVMLREAIVGEKFLVLVGYLRGPIRAEGVCCCRDRAVATGSANLLKITVDVMFAD
jgi:hypothetical protein